MKLLSLNCNQCGATLLVPEFIRFLTCSYCQRKLKVVESGGAFFTNVLEHLDVQASGVRYDLRFERLHEELDRLDKAQHLKEATQDVTGRNTGGTVLSFAFLGMMGSLYLGARLGDLMGLAVVATGVLLFLLILFVVLVSQDALKQAREQQRDQLLQKFEELRQPLTFPPARPTPLPTRSISARSVRP